MPPPTPPWTRPKPPRDVRRPGRPTSPASQRSRVSPLPTALRLFTSPVTMCSTAPARGPTARTIPLTPLGVYGQTKAAGDQIVATLPHHYIVRTSWVIGDGPNFVRTMLSLAARGINPSVVDDQRGRLTFTSELARAIRHLVETRAPYGTYNVTGSGPVTSWADVARQVSSSRATTPTESPGSAPPLLRSGDGRLHHGQKQCSGPGEDCLHRIHTEGRR